MTSFAFAMLFAVLAFADGAVVSYGVCAHPMQDEFTTRDKMFQMMADAGIGSLRCECLWGLCQRKKGDSLSFDKFDKVCASADAKGVEIVPVLHGAPAWARPVQNHLDAYRRYVREFMSHYRGRFTAIEVWNEENGKSFWSPVPNASEYAELLRISHEEIRAADPSVRIVLGGLAGVPLDYVKRLYSLGAGSCFDVMCIHPYVHPAGPEGWLVNAFGQLRAVMAQNGDEAKPVWFTELGWPTHMPDIGGEGGLLPAGLKVARPGKKTWHAVFVENVHDGLMPDQTLARVFESRFPGSDAVVLGPKAAAERISRSEFDLVVFPFAQLYPRAAADAVEKFVKDGGTLVAIGGFPFWNEYENLPDGTSRKTSNRPDKARLARLHIGLDAHFLNDRSAPAELTVMATPTGVVSGVRLPPNGLRANGFYTAARLAPGDEMVPLLEGIDTEGVARVGACVYRFDSELKGSIVASAVPNMAKSRSVNEDEQAAMLARAYMTAFALGVEKLHWYEFRSTEKDPFYSEHHFGITHRDLSPKPAYRAYAALTRRRPVGSASSQKPWRTGRSGVVRPEWILPDGRTAGAVWLAEAKCGVFDVCFESDNVRLYDLYGTELHAGRPRACTRRFSIGGSPVYFEGAGIATVERLRTEVSRSTTTCHAARFQE